MRPTAAVLSPVTVRKAAADRVEVLTATNRNPDVEQGGYESTRADNLTFERYEISVPRIGHGITITYPSAKPDPQHEFVVTERQELAADAFLRKAAGTRQWDGTMGIFVHGCYYSHQEALFRMAQMGADAKTKAAPILFS